MAAQAKRVDGVTAPQSRESVDLRAASGDEAPCRSPARDLQTALAGAHYPAPVTPKWPGAARIGVVLGGSALLWGLLGATAVLIFR